MELARLLLPGWIDALDIALVSGAGWLAIRYFRRTRARAALLGLALLGLIYVAAQSLGLHLAAALLQGFFAVVVLVLIVVFQEDLRRLFEQLGSLRARRSQAPPESETLDLLVRAVARLAATRTGALIVLPGREPLDRHVEGGVALRGRISEPLLYSLFDASSPGHDGAVIVRGDAVERFAAHLPLSSNHDALGPGGTRHAAALGLAERCDAICIVVSEERGTVSLARDGNLRPLDRAEDLVVLLRDRFEPELDPIPWWRGGAGLDAAAATAGAFALWMALVPGSAIDEVNLLIPIEVANLPADLEIEEVVPDHTEVTLRGLRRQLILVDDSDVSIRLDAYLARMGRRTFELTPADVQTAAPLEVITLEPDTVRISLRKATPNREGTSAPEGAGSPR